MPKLLVEHRGPVTLLTLSRPEGHNSVDAELAVALGEAIEAFAADAGARVLVLTGAGELAFSAGANLKAIDDLGKHAYVDKAGPMGFARLDPKKPTIAAVNGYCFAGGWSWHAGATFASRLKMLSSVLCTDAGSCRSPTVERSVSRALSVRAKHSG